MMALSITARGCGLFSALKERPLVFSFNKPDDDRASMSRDLPLYQWSYYCQDKKG